MSDCNLNFNAENDCTPQGTLTRSARLRLHPDKNRGSCEKAANQAFINANSACMSQNGVPVAPLGPKGRAAVAETLLGPKGLIAAIFKNEKGIVVPTYAEVKNRRANPQQPSPVAAKSIALLNTALKAVDKSAAKGGLPAAQSALLAQMKKMVDLANKKGGKGAKLLSQLYKKAISQKKGGAQAPEGNQAAQQQQVVAQNPADVIAIPAAVERQLRGNGAIRTALNQATMRYTVLVQDGQAASPEALALWQTIMMMDMVTQDNERRRQWLNMQRFHQIVPYITTCAAVVLAAAAAYYMILTIEGAAAFVLGVGGGIIRVFVSGFIDIVMAPVRRMPYMNRYAVDGHEVLEGAMAAARNYTGDDFAEAAEEARRLGFGAEVTAGILLFLIFLFTTAIVSLPFQDREWAVGYGLVRVGRRAEAQDNANPFLYPAAAAAALPAPAQPIAAPAPVAMINNPPANPGDPGVVAEVDGGGKRRRRRRTKKRRKKRKGRSRKRVKRKRRSTRKRRRNRRRRRTRSRR